MTKNFWKDFKSPIIGLAPMEGYSDSAFRQVCKKINPSIVTYTEFTSADGLFHNAKSVKKKLSFLPSEQPLIAQIFGKDIKTFISAAKLCEDLGFTGLDLNMGCPAKKVVRSEHGVALRKNHSLACRLVEAVATNCSLPISVKTRLGWSDASDLISFSTAVESAGADMICIHARTYQNPYGVPANWEPLYELKKSLQIPLLGNGGVLDVQDGLAKIKNLDGFLIGQASFGNPWVFSDVSSHLSITDKLPLILFHAEALIRSKGELVGCREIRKHLLSYCRGFSGAKQLRSALCHVASFQDIVSCLDQMA
ncbi:MAG: tRNA-dihydrouridine synthase family protein [bacterium]